MKKTKTNRLITSLFIAIFLTGCISKLRKNDDTPNVSKPLEMVDISSNATGWGPNPRALANAKDASSVIDSNWYTKRYTGKANERSVEIKSNSFMESTCRHSVKKENSKALLESAYASISPDIKPEVVSSLTNKITKEDMMNIEVSDCKPTSSSKTFAECECALSYKAEGGKKALIDKVAPIIK